MARHPAAATWIPLLALVLLVGVSVHLTQEAPDRPGARLLTAVQAFCVAVSSGEDEAALDHLAPGSRSALNAQRVARVVAERRGALWMVVKVDPDSGTTEILWLAAISDDERRQEVLHWASQPDGAWKLVL